MYLVKVIPADGTFGFQVYAVDARDLAQFRKEHLVYSVEWRG